MEKLLTFLDLKLANVSRDALIFHHIHSWSITDYGCAIAGEVGEMCNFLKKMRRGDGDFTRDVGKEMADAICYIDLLASKMGMDLEREVSEKFNEISKRKNCGIILPPPG